jgi:hypothetical protein
VEVVGGIVVDVVVDVEDVVVEVVTAVVAVDSSAGSATVVATEVSPPQAATIKASPHVNMIVITEEQRLGASTRSVIPCTALRP